MFPAAATATAPSRLAPHPSSPAAGVAGDRELLRLAIPTLQDVVLVTDTGLDAPGPRILALAGDVERLTGYAPAELVGRSARIFHGPQTPRAALVRIRDALAAGRACREELLHYRKDGSSYWVELQASPVRDAAGRVTHYASLQRDVSDRRRMRRSLFEAAQRERDGIARELHDALGQELVGVSLSLAALEAQLGGREAPAQAVLAEAQQRLQGAIGQARSLAHGLAPIRLGAGGLPGALRVLARTLSDAFYVTIDVQSPARLGTALGTEALGDVYRIAHEALLNALRHGQPHRVALRLAGSRSRLALEVEDDGVGFEPGEVARGLGLDAMRFRARELGGTLEIHARRGHGTRVRLRVDLRD
jgi:PAS domain S-box-containing protein